MQNGTGGYRQAFNRIMTESLHAKVKPRVLLHCCCAPCSSSVLELLSPVFNLTAFFYNPNIFPEEEYQRRREEFRKLFAQVGYADDICFIEGDYTPKLFYTVAKGYEQLKEGQERCLRCFALRLQMTAITAKRMDYDYFGSTLTVSPHKDADSINEIGQMIGEQVGISWLPGDFKKNNGFIRSIELSREYGLYRQSYCGCEYSFTERFGNGDD